MTATAATNHGPSWEAQERLRDCAEDLFFVLDDIVSALRQDGLTGRAYATEIAQAERVLRRAMGAEA